MSVIKLSKIIYAQNVARKCTTFIAQILVIVAAHNIVQEGNHAANFFTVLIVKFVTITIKISPTENMKQYWSKMNELLVLNLKKDT